MQHHQDKKNSDEKQIYCKKQETICQGTLPWQPNNFAAMKAN